MPDINLEIVKYLVEKGIVPTGSAIDFASRYGYLDIVKYLFEKGIVPRSDAIDWATQNGHLEVVEYLESII